MKYWLQRISYQQGVAHPLLFNHNYLSIGFSEISPIKVIEKCKNNDWVGFEDEFLEAWGFIPRIRYNLWNFVNGMQKGDWVLVPTQGAFSIFEIISENVEIASDISISGLKDWEENRILINNENASIVRDGTPPVEVDLGFFRKVKPLFLEISRDAYADQTLTARLKARSSNLNISDLEDNIKATVSSYVINKPINLHNIILEQSAPIVYETIVRQLNPDKFERLIKWYFQRNLATSVDIPAKNETGKSGDTDVIATFDNLKLIIYVQAKFHNGFTSSWAIEQVKAYKDEKESLDDGYNRIGWVITSAEQFDQTAMEMAKLHNINLINGLEFSRMLIESGIQSLGNAL